MRKQKLFILGFSLTCVLLSACGSQPEKKDFYDFCYNVNYEKGANRVDSIASGEKAEKWNAKRQGYTLVNWYKDSNYQTLYDFNTPVLQDTMIYAKWEFGGERHQVNLSFNYNYEGCSDPVNYVYNTGDTISLADVPVPHRFNYSATGWYKEPECINKWSFTTDAITDNTVLYAGYSKTEELKYDDDGMLKFDNITIDFAPNVLSWGSKGENHQEVDQLMGQFNREFSGKIRVNKTIFGGGENVTLEDTGFINQYYQDYYNVDEIIKEARIPNFSIENDFYESAVSENWINGRFKSLPFMDMVPYIVYSKRVLNDLNKTWSNNCEDIYNLIMDADNHYEGDDSWKGAFAGPIGGGWALYEVTSHAIWSNNGLGYISYNPTTHLYEENFSKPENRNKVKNAVITSGRIFGYECPVHKKSVGDARDLAKHKILMMLTGSKADIGYLLDWTRITEGKEFSEQYGVCPAYNMFNYDNILDSTVFAKGFSFGIRATSTDPYKVAASAVFANWMSQHAGRVAERFLAPTNKLAWEDDDFKLNGDLCYKIIRAGVDPSRVSTMAGHKYNYQFYNYTNQNIFSSVNSVVNLTEATIDNLIEAFSQSLSQNL